MNGYDNYFEKDGQYFKQSMTWWEKGGYYVPQTPKKISKDVYDKMISIQKDKELSND